MENKAKVLTLKRNGFSEAALYGLQTALEAADIAIWARRRWLRADDGFMWRKDDGSLCTLGDVLVTHHIVDSLRRELGSVFFLTEEDMSKYLRLQTKADLSSDVTAIIDGIDGTFYYAQYRAFAIWFGLAQNGYSWCSFFVEVGRDDKIKEIAIAERFKGSWIYKPGEDWKKVRPAPWDGLSQPNIGHGLPFSSDVRFRAFADFLAGPNFRGWEPRLTEIVPIGRAAIDVICGKQQLYSHALLPAWDWFPLRLFMEESGLAQLWYRIDGAGKLKILRPGPRREDYHRESRLCLNIGTVEFVGVVNNFLRGQDREIFFREAKTGDA